MPPERAADEVTMLCGLAKEVTLDAKQECGDRSNREITIPSH